MFIKPIQFAFSFLCGPSQELGTEYLIFILRGGGGGGEGGNFPPKLPGPNFVRQNIQDQGKCYNTLCKKRNKKT